VIEIAVRQVAESGDYALILTSPVAYAAPTIDITDQILEWLETTSRTASREAALTPVRNGMAAGSTGRAL
jgi:hypothetical protein